MRRIVMLVALAGVPVIALEGCRTAGPGTPTGPALQMACDHPLATKLGVPTVRRLAQLTTSGGRLRFVVKALPPPSIFSERNDTEVQLGDIDDPTDVRYRVTASPRRPGTIDVEAGTYSVLNTNLGAIDVVVCPDVTVSDVKVAHPVAASSAPTSPPGHQSHNRTPGTSPSDP